MNRFKSTVLLFSFIAIAICSIQARDYELYSPDNGIRMVISLNEKITYSVWVDGRIILSPSAISMKINDKTIPGNDARILKIKKDEVDEIVKPVVRTKCKEIRNRYNELTMFFKDNFTLSFRAYNEGVAYRFNTSYKDEIKVDGEEVNYNFGSDYNVYFPEDTTFQSSNERSYKYLAINSICKNRFGSLPVLVDTRNELKIAISESDLEDYPGLWVQGTCSNALKGIFPGYALEVEKVGKYNISVKKHAPYIALTKGTRSFPWRIMAIARNDAEIITNQMVYLLGNPSRLQDVSWIKPGKIAWDWWNANNVYNVDFKSGVNNDTYKYYIDFASANGLEYVILDEGWSDDYDLLKLNPEINMEELCNYAKQKNVGIILWLLWSTLDSQLEQALSQFQKWGIKGIKVDFMDRDDQWMVNYYHRIASEAAKHKLMVDFHGAHKPTGLNRTYPNVMTSEGVKGLEYNKWSAQVTPEHNVTLPFIRMWAGPMDYTPGAMVNAQKEDFRVIFNDPMSQGTRCHQLAMYVVYESPLQMLADNPTHYYEEPECLKFLSKVPAVWDTTVVLNAKVADYITVARKKDSDWYIGSMGDENPRELNIDFSFLEPGKTYTAEIYQDGINASRIGKDFKMITRNVVRAVKLTIKLAPGGGWAARIYEK